MRKHYRPNGYTEADQRSDTSFLVGTRLGRELVGVEARRWVSSVRTGGVLPSTLSAEDVTRLLDAVDPGWREALDR